MHSILDRSRSRGSALALLLGVALVTPWPLHAAGDTGKLTDANIAAIVLAANTIDIENGKLAEARSHQSSVRDFAMQMVTDHTSVNEKAAALAKRLKLVPRENSASRALVANADSTREQMGKLSGIDFDRAYVNNEVAYHQAVLDLLDRTLVPGARNQELKNLLTGVRPAFVAHLEHARMIQA
jgi:putative membrane protein